MLSDAGTLWEGSVAIALRFLTIVPLEDCINNRFGDRVKDFLLCAFHAKSLCEALMECQVLREVPCIDAFMSGAPVARLYLACLFDDDPLVPFGSSNLLCTSVNVGWWWS